MLYMIVVAYAVTACSDGDGKTAQTEEQTITEVQRLTMQQLNEISESAYEDMEAGDLEAMKVKVAQLAALASKLSYEGVATIDGIQVISQSIAETMHALNATRPDDHKVTMSMVRTRLVIDALSHKEQPMWLGFRKQVVQDLDALSAAARNADDQAASQSLALWKGHVSLIRPAIIVSREMSDAIKLDSITAFLDHEVKAGEWEAIRQAMPDLQDTVKQIFDERQNNDHETVAPIAPTSEPPHPLLWSLTLGTMIVLVLTWVAWRKYNAGHGIVRVKKEQDFNNGI
jgi:sporulation protein YpjB